MVANVVVNNATMPTGDIRDGTGSSEGTPQPMTVCAVVSLVSLKEEVSYAKV